MVCVNTSLAQTGKPSKDKSKSETKINEETKKDVPSFNFWDGVTFFGSVGLLYDDLRPFTMVSLGVGYNILPKSFSMGVLYSSGSTISEGFKFTSFGAFGRFKLLDIDINSIFLQGEFVSETRIFINQYVNGFVVPRYSTEPSTGLHLGVGYSYNIVRKLHTDFSFFYNINQPLQPVSVRWGLSYNF
jgi:hypothetical protein